MSPTLSKADKRWLETTFGERVRFGEPMSRHVSLRVGGPAEAFVKPNRPEEAATLLRWAWRNGIPHRVIGDGTNLLVRDDGIPGIVVVLTRCLGNIGLEGANGDETTLRVEAGARLKTLCRFACDHGLGGMAFAAGIPGTVGGAVMMNAGTAAGAMADVLTAITLLSPDGSDITLPRERLSFRYRALNPPDSETGSPPVVIEAQLALSKSGKSSDLLRRETKALLRRRLERQPLRYPSAGCFFQNPPGHEPAGRLIDLAGLKGRRIGDAQISPMHANFLINRGGATAAQVLALSDLVRNTVLKRFNVLLEPEVRILS